MLQAIWRWSALKCHFSYNRFAGEDNGLSDGRKETQRGVDALLRGVAKKVDFREQFQCLTGQFLELASAAAPFPSASDRGACPVGLTHPLASRPLQFHPPVPGVIRSKGNVSQEAPPLDKRSLDIAEPKRFGEKLLL